MGGLLGGLLGGILGRLFLLPPRGAGLPEQAGPRACRRQLSCMYQHPVWQQARGRHLVWTCAELGAGACMGGMQISYSSTGAAMRTEPAAVLEIAEQPRQAEPARDRTPTRVPSSPPPAAAAEVTREPGGCPFGCCRIDCAVADVWWRWPGGLGGPALGQVQPAALEQQQELDGQPGHVVG